MVTCKANGITVFQSELYQTNSIVVELEECVLVVDPTWLPSEVLTIRDYVESKANNKKVFLIFTHSDWDHIIGYRAFQDVTTIGSLTLAQMKDADHILNDIRKFDDQYYIVRPYPIDYPVVDITVDRDGQQLEFGDATVTFYLAPGHTNCGIFTIVEPLGLFIAGDYLSDLEFPFIEHSVDDYVSTMNKVEELLHNHIVSCMVPGHGTTTQSIAEVFCRKDRALSYISTLKSHIVENNQMDIEKITASYPFPLGLREAHVQNLKVVPQVQTSL